MSEWEIIIACAGLIWIGLMVLVVRFFAKSKD